MRVSFATMGCRSNFADSVELQAALAAEGAIPCGSDSEAEVCLINTCTVTDSAESEVRSLIRSARKRNPAARIVITGCLATVGSPVFEELTERDSVIAAGKRSELLEEILSDEGGARLTLGVAKRSDRHVSEDLDHPLHVTSPTERIGEIPMRKRFHLRVQEGCDNFCTFCIIPFTRGKAVSRSPGRVMEDLKKLTDAGYQEVVLTGTHLGGYGEDIGSSLYELLQLIAKSKLPTRIRLSSLDPNDVDFEMIDLLADEKVFCEHLHLCFQALDDTLLKRMNRPYELSDAMELLEYARKRLPTAALGTDLITGFPGESDKLFEIQCSRFEETPLSYVHVFPYSERAGTAATKLGGEVAQMERKRRSARLRAIAGRRYREFGRSFVGREVEVVVESLKERDGGLELKGTTREFVEATALLARSGIRPKLGGCVYLKASTFDEVGETLQCVL